MFSQNTIVIKTLWATEKRVLSDPPVETSDRWVGQCFSLRTPLLSKTGKSGKAVLSIQHWSQITGGTENRGHCQPHWSQITGRTENVVLSEQHWSEITVGEWLRMVFSQNTNGVKSQGGLREVVSQNIIGSNHRGE